MKTKPPGKRDIWRNLSEMDFHLMDALQHILIQCFQSSVFFSQGPHEAVCKFSRVKKKVLGVFGVALSVWVSIYWNVYEKRRIFIFSHLLGAKRIHNSSTGILKGMYCDRRKWTIFDIFSEWIATFSQTSSWHLPSIVTIVIIQQNEMTCSGKRGFQYFHE